MEKNSKYPFSLMVGLLAAIVCVIFAVQNSNEVEIDLLFWEITMALALVILVSVTLGALITICLSLPSRWSMKRELRQLRKQIQSYEKDMKKVGTENTEKA